MQELYREKSLKRIDMTQITLLTILSLILGFEDPILLKYFWQCILPYVQYFWWTKKPETKNLTIVPLKFITICLYFQLHSSDLWGPEAESGSHRDNLDK